MSIADWEMGSDRNISSAMMHHSASIADWEMGSDRNQAERALSLGVSIADWEMGSDRNNSISLSAASTSIADWEMGSSLRTYWVLVTQQLISGRPEPVFKLGQISPKGFRTPPQGATCSTFGSTTNCYTYRQAAPFWMDYPADHFISRIDS